MHCGLSTFSAQVCLHLCSTALIFRLPVLALPV